MLPASVARLLIISASAILAVGAVLAVFMLQGRVSPAAVAICSMLVSVLVIIYSIDRIKRRRKT